MIDDLVDPFAAPAAVYEEFDPFATSSDVKSNGVFVPRPPIESLAERLIVMVPRSFDAEAKVSEYLQAKGFPETREEWTIDLIVLDGGELSFEYRAKKENTEDEYEPKTMTVTEFPFEVPNFKVSWANMIGTLNKLSASPRPFGLGRIRAGYSAKDMRKGKTFEMFAAEMSEWEEKVRKNPRTAGERPKPKWHFVMDESPQALALARAWWTDAKARGFKVS